MQTKGTGPDTARVRRTKLAGRKALRYMWGFKKLVGSVLYQERGPGTSTVTRLLIQPLGPQNPAVSQWAEQLCG